MVGVTLRCAPAEELGLSLPSPELFVFPGSGSGTGGAKKGPTLGLDHSLSHWAFRFPAHWLPESQPLPLSLVRRTAARG